MNRRHFLLAALALGLCSEPAIAAAPRFEPARFSVEIRGDGPDVLLIPGLSSGRAVWERTVADLPGRRYHLVQVSGFAGEPARGNRQGALLAPLADEIARYIAERGLRRPAIVGHSMGGTLAMMVAARRPELVRRIMVVDMLPQPASLYGGSASTWAPLANLLGNYFSSPNGQRAFANMMAALSPPNAGNYRSDPDVVGRAMREMAATDLTPQLSNIRAPMTIVYASPDPQARALLDRSFTAAYAPVRGARLVRIDGSGHMVMADQPARFQAELRRFLGP